MGSCMYMYRYEWVTTIPVCVHNINTVGVGRDTLHTNVVEGMYAGVDMRYINSVGVTLYPIVASK